MTVRARLTTVVLLVGAVTSGCGGGGAPSDASPEGFCEAADSLLSDVVPEDLGTPELPTDEHVAEAVKDWGSRMEEVGTPEDIPDDARQGFEAIVDEVREIDVADFSVDDLEDLGSGGDDASEEVRRQADAFGDYLTETCGSPLDDLEMPEMPEMPGTTE